MERTIIENGTVYVGELEFTRLIGQLIRRYKFLNKNQVPKTIIFPPVIKVEGVIVEYEVKEVATKGAG